MALKWKPVARSPHTPQIRGALRSKSPGSGREVLAAMASIPVGATGWHQVGHGAGPWAPVGVVHGGVSTCTWCCWPFGKDLSQLVSPPPGASEPRSRVDLSLPPCPISHRAQDPWEAASPTLPGHPSAPCPPSCIPICDISKFPGVPAPALLRRSGWGRGATSVLQGHFYPTPLLRSKARVVVVVVAAEGAHT